MKKSIFNIEQEYVELAETIIDSGGELTPEQETALAINRESLEVKAVQYGYVIKDLKNDLENIKKEMDRLSELKSSREKLMARLKDTVSQAMQLYGIEKIEVGFMKIKFLSSTSVLITDEDAVPDKYKKVVKTVSKTIVGEALKQGIEVAGAELSHNKNIQFG